MFLKYLVFLMATVDTSSGIASLGNGSIKKISFHAKMAKYCLKNPSFCRFKMEVKKKQQQEQQQEGEEKMNNDDKEIDPEEERFRAKSRNNIANSQMQCHFTEKASFRIVHFAKNIKQEPVSDIAKGLKNLIHDLLLQPQAIIICQPRDEELGDLLKTDNNNNKNDNIENIEIARRNNAQNTRKNEENNVNDPTRSTTAEDKLTNFESTKNDVDYSDVGTAYTKAQSDNVTRPNSVQNVPSKREYNSKKKTLDYATLNHQNMPQKNELNDHISNQSYNDDDTLNQSYNEWNEDAQINNKADNSVSTKLNHEDVQIAKLARLIKLLIKNANTQQ